jgi:hypothetical protein
MAIRATKRDENSHRPITNRLPDAIRPHMQSRQYEAFDRAGGLLAGRSPLGNRPAIAGRLWRPAAPDLYL